MRLFSNSVLIIFIYFSDRGWYNIDFRSSYQSEYQRRLESSDPLYNSHPNAHVLHYHPQHPYRRFGRSWTQKLGAKKRQMQMQTYSNDVSVPSMPKRVWFYTKIFYHITDAIFFYTLSYNEIIDWFDFFTNKIILKLSQKFVKPPKNSTFKGKKKNSEIIFFFQ